MPKSQVGIAAISARSDFSLESPKLATLSFLALLFLEIGKENHQKKQGFVIPTETLKSPGKELGSCEGGGKTYRSILGGENVP